MHCAFPHHHSTATASIQAVRQCPYLAFSMQEIGGMPGLAVFYVDCTFAASPTQDQYVSIDDCPGAVVVDLDCGIELYSWVECESGEIEEGH